MAIYHFTTKIIGAAKGKCAVASAAYQAAEKLYDERLGQSFSYTHKEEVILSEVMLPENAPEEYADREVLWNAVEKVQNKSNSRYARGFEMALPKELSRDQQMELARDFIRENFVEKGMAVDWAFHEKKGNPHIHVMCTVRCFTKTGSWAQMEKKVYATDGQGNKIPEIDPKTGEQKVRIRKGKGEEKLWKRVTVQANGWNSRRQLLEWRKNWAEACNRYLLPEQQIDHRSFLEQGLDRVPTVHEGYAAREIEEHGGTSRIIQENRSRQEANTMLGKIDQLVATIRVQFEALRQGFCCLCGRRRDDEERSEGKNRHGDYIDGYYQRLPDAHGRNDGGTGEIREQTGIDRGTKRDDGAPDRGAVEASFGIPKIGKKLSAAVERIQSINEQFEDRHAGERTVAGIKRETASADRGVQEPTVNTDHKKEKTVAAKTELEIEPVKKKKPVKQAAEAKTGAGKKQSILAQLGVEQRSSEHSRSNGKEKISVRAKLREKQKAIAEREKMLQRTITVLRGGAER